MFFNASDTTFPYPTLHKANLNGKQNDLHLKHKLLHNQIHLSSIQPPTFFD